MKAQNPKINRISPRHVDITFGIRLNDKNNYLLDASYKGLTGFRTNNSEAYNHIQSIRAEVMNKYANSVVTPILLDNPEAPTQAKVNFTSAPALSSGDSIESSIAKQDQLIDSQMMRFT